MWARVTDQRLFIALVGVLVVLAWLVLWVWGWSPYARYLEHWELAELIEESGVLFIGLVFVAGWILMLVAMMLPTSLPLVTLFRRLVRQRLDHRRLVLLLIAGYLGIWTLFGVIVLISDWGLHQALEGIEWFEWLEDNAWALGAATLVLAGLYQFTRLKYHCLDKCRSPLSFIVEHWQGSHEQAQAFRLGVHHGIFCIGCCWSLMLLMFVIGMGNLGWMLVLGTVMAVEKNMPWGRRLSTPLGVVLLGWGLTMVLLATLPL